MIRCIEKDIKFLKPVDVSNNEEVVWSVHNGRIYLVVIFSMTAAEMRIPDNEDEDPTIELSDLSRRYIKETNEMCRQIQRKCKVEVCRFIVVPDGRLTPYPLALVGEQCLYPYSYLYQLYNVWPERPPGVSRGQSRSGP